MTVRDTMKTVRLISTSVWFGLACVLSLNGCAVRQPVVVNKEAALYKEFSDRLNSYVELHKRVEKELPALNKKTDPAEIHAHEGALGKAIRAARVKAQPGDIFFASVRTRIVRIVRDELRGARGAGARTAILQGNPASEPPSARVRVSVNAAYPDSAPLSTVPPALLQKLPQLPEQLDYRFVGRDLILRDTTANLIVDYIREAVAIR